MTKCFSCECEKQDDGFSLCQSCQKSLLDFYMSKRAKRYNGLAEKECKRGKNNA